MVKLSFRVWVRWPFSRFSFTVVEPLISYNAPLHIETIRYWACIETKMPEQLFRVSQTMLAILNDCDT